jgi:hypothetical protein
MLRIVFLGIAPSGLPFSLCSNVIPRVLLTQSRDCQCFALSSSALILTQSLSNKREAFVWLFSFSPAYTSELVTLP